MIDTELDIDDFLSVGIPALESEAAALTFALIEQNLTDIQADPCDPSIMSRLLMHIADDPRRAAVVLHDLSCVVGMFVLRRSAHRGVDPGEEFETLRAEWRETLGRMSRPSEGPQ